jgi:hypothetical protein
MAKRMILIDEREYHELWKRPATDRSKSYLNSKLQTQLDSVESTDDVKAKEYQKTLHRFLNLKQKIPELQPTALNGLIAENSKKKKKAEKSRQSQRKHVKWSKYHDA